MIRALLIASVLVGCGGGGNKGSNELATNEPASNEPASNEPASNEPASNEPAKTESAPSGTEATLPAPPPAQKPALSDEPMAVRHVRVQG